MNHVKFVEQVTNHELQQDTLGFIVRSEPHLLGKREYLYSWVGLERTNLAHYIFKV